MSGIINLEDTIGKTVGKPRGPTTPKEIAAYAVGIQKSVADFHRCVKTPFLPRGVYRFRTHEEADAWQWKMLTRNR